jgi:site-specific DNA-methyltransferase (adenine-specific)
VKYTCLLGDAEVVLKNFAANTFDACLCDPPYGVTSWARTGNKPWEKLGIPPVSLWAEVLRTLKPGAPILAASAARTYHRIAGSIEDAGFVIEDQIDWCYSGGKPYYQRLRNGCRDHLRPAHEPFCFARKPHRGTWDDNIKTWGVGGVLAGRNVIGEVPEEYTRFFWCGKSSKKERAMSTHSTLKPFRLTQYLAGLVLPDRRPATILVPFSGAGSEMIGAMRAGWTHVVGIEKNRTYHREQRARIRYFLPTAKHTDVVTHRMVA